MRHTVTFGGKNCWTDWKLMPVNTPVIAMPPLRSNLIELPGLSGEIDLSEAITGYPIFGSRTGQLNFLMVDHFNRWRGVIREIRHYLHGQRMILTLQDIPDWYFIGRFSIDDAACDELHGTVAIGYTLEPYMYAVDSTDSPWLWDPFSFVDGVIRERVFTGISIASGADLEFTEMETGDMPVSPEFVADSAATLTIIGDTTITKALTADTPITVPGLVLYRGNWLYNGHPATVSAVTAGGGAITFAITDQPVNFTGEVSTTGSYNTYARFHVDAVSDSEITYQWQYKSTSGNWTTPTSSTFVDKDTDTVLVPITTNRNGYQFRCQVTSGGETITSNAGTLTTGTPTFAIIQHPLNQLKQPGDSFVLYVGAQGSSLSYQWQSKTPTGSWTDVSGETNYKLSVSNVTAEDNGSQYRCIVTSGGNTLTSDAATLTVVTGVISIIFRPGRL